MVLTAGQEGETMPDNLDNNSQQLSSLTRAIAGAINSLIFKHHFQLPIDVIFHADNGSCLIGSFDAALDGQGLTYNQQEARLPAEGLRLPITITFLDGASGRSAGVVIENYDTVGGVQ
jgi:hypothetical protein